VCVHKLYPEASDCVYQPFVGLNLLPKPVWWFASSFFMNARLCTWFCSYNSACTDIFIHRSTGRDAAITMNGFKSRNHAVMSNEVLADRTAACSTIGYRRNSWASCWPCFKPNHNFCMYQKNEKGYCNFADNYRLKYSILSRLITTVNTFKSRTFLCSWAVKAYSACRRLANANKSIGEREKIMLAISACISTIILLSCWCMLMPLQSLLILCSRSRRL